MKETEWISSFVSELSSVLQEESPELRVKDRKKLPYSNQILWYDSNNQPESSDLLSFETDILIYEVKNDLWKPRVVIEGKKETVNTHDSITYSQKAMNHKYVHPYLRYGIILGNRKGYPLPGRLFRHGLNFDFMLSWNSFKPTFNEWTTFIKIIKEEVVASKKLEEMIFNSRSKTRKHYFTLHKPLNLGE